MADGTIGAAATDPGAEGAVSPDQAVEVALGLLRKRELGAAIGILETVLEVEPTHPMALNSLGVATFHLKGAEASASFLKSAIERLPGNAGLHNNLGNAYVELGDIDAAVEAYDRAIELDPKLADPYCNLASIVKHAGNPEFAERLLRTAIEIHPEFGVAYQNLASLLLDGGRPREAIDYFWKATAYLPDKAVPAHFLAMAYWFAGLKDLAIDFVKKWADANPGDAQAQHMRASMTGENVPERASDLYVSKLFDKFANSFDSKLESLDYRAPELVGTALRLVVGKAAGLSILDAGCGTGKCAKFLRKHARSLVGVDLSAGMLDKAAKLTIYDDLYLGELTEFLAAQSEEYDVIVSADTLCYFGRLDRFAAAAAGALKPDGLLVFTVEALESDGAPDFKLAVNGRYAHSEAYVRTTLAGAGIETIDLTRAQLRMENAEPVIGLVVSARLRS